MAQFKKGDYVAWKWVSGYGHGTVQSVHADRTIITSHGKQITRNGTANDPAVLIIDHNDTPVLKLAHELQPTEKET